MSYCGSESEENLHLFPECPRYNQQRDELIKQLNDVSVHFHINYILDGSSDISYNLNKKPFSYVHINVRASKHF